MVVKHISLAVAMLLFGSLALPFLSYLSQCLNVSTSFVLYHLSRTVVCGRWSVVNSGIDLSR